VCVFFKRAGCHIGRMLLAFYQLFTVVDSGVLNFLTNSRCGLIFAIKAINVKTVLGNFIP